MIYEKGSIDYDINLCSLQEMEEAVPMTLLERSRLRSWAKDGHDVDSNPWKMYEPDGSDMNYLKAHRIRFGVHMDYGIPGSMHLICVRCRTECLLFGASADKSKVDVLNFISRAVAFTFANLKTRPYRPVCSACFSAMTDFK